MPALGGSFLSDIERAIEAIDIGTYLVIYLVSAYTLKEQAQIELFKGDMARQGVGDCRYRAARVYPIGLIDHPITIDVLEFHVTGTYAGTLVSVGEHIQGRLKYPFLLQHIKCAYGMTNRRAGSVHIIIYTTGSNRLVVQQCEHFI